MTGGALVWVWEAAGKRRLKPNIAEPEPTSVLHLSICHSQCGAGGEGGGWNAPGRPCCCWCVPPWGSSILPSAPWGMPPSPSPARGPSTATPGSPEVSDRARREVTPPGDGWGFNSPSPRFYAARSVIGCYELSVYTIYVYMYKKMYVDVFSKCYVFLYNSWGEVHHLERGHMF